MLSVAHTTIGHVGRTVIHCFDLRPLRLHAARASSLCVSWLSLHCVSTELSSIPSSVGRLAATYVCLTILLLAISAQALCKCHRWLCGDMSCAFALHAVYTNENVLRMLQFCLLTYCCRVCRLVSCNIGRKRLRSFTISQTQLHIKTTFAPAQSFSLPPCYRYNTTASCVHHYHDDSNTLSKQHTYCCPNVSDSASLPCRCC